jgi:hypothetical protein
VYPNVGVILNFLGSTASNMIAYIIPAAIYLKVGGGEAKTKMWYLALG